ncbi:isochorismatase family protein [Phormidesmis priestleyi]
MGLIQDLPTSSHQAAFCSIVHKYLSLQLNITCRTGFKLSPEIHESVTPQPDEMVIVKHFPNSFRETHLLEYLKSSEVEEVVIGGAMSHMCIDATTRAAFDFGFQCTVIEDACATRDLEYKSKTVKAAEVHAAFMAALAMPYAKVISTDEFGRVQL